MKNNLIGRHTPVQVCPSFFGVGPLLSKDGLIPGATYEPEFSGMSQSMRCFSLLHTYSITDSVKNMAEFVCSGWSHESTAFFFIFSNGWDYFELVLGPHMAPGLQAGLLCSSS